MHQFNWVSLRNIYAAGLSNCHSMKKSTVWTVDIAIGYELSPRVACNYSGEVITLFFADELCAITMKHQLLDFRTDIPLMNKNKLAVAIIVLLIILMIFASTVHRKLTIKKSFPLELI